MTGIRLALLAATAAVAGLAAADAAVTRGPYLQIPRPNGIVVRWRTDVATDSRVRYGAAPGALTLVADEPASTTEHEVALTGLAADTRYYYSVGSAGGALVGDDAAHFFRTPPPAGTVKPTRIWVTGDGGFADANAAAVRDAFATFNAGNETGLWLLLGDNAYVVGSDADYQAALFDMHQDLLRRVPTWPTFGNHEALSSNSLSQTGPYFDMFTLPTGAEAGGEPSGTEAYYSFDHANAHFIVLDSHFSANTPGSPMMLWLEADLQATTADWVIAYWHHPPYSKGLLHDSDVEGREINMRENVLPLLEEYGVDLVLCGHSHSYERSNLVDGHYDFSPTLTPEMVLDSGDGNPLGDGPYRKPSVGPAPHEGAVYVVAGSSSEVRTANLNHPVMEVGLLELGSLVLDIDGNRLTGTFLNSLVQTTDTFGLIKGPVCPPAPLPGCHAGARGTLLLKDDPADAGDRLAWRWKGGTLDSAELGAPDDQTDLAFCLYDQTGALVGRALPHGADLPPGAIWAPFRGGLRYLGGPAPVGGIVKVRIAPGPATPTWIVVKGKGSGLGVPALPLALPITAQLANLDGGSCWQSVLTRAKKNGPAKVLARGP